MQLSEAVRREFKQAIMQAEEYRAEPDVTVCSSIDELYALSKASDCWDAGVMFYAKLEGKDVYLINQIIGSEFAVMVNDKVVESLSISQMTFEDFSASVMDEIMATQEEVEHCATKGAYARRKAEAAGAPSYTEKYIGFTGVELSVDPSTVAKAAVRLLGCYGRGRADLTPDDIAQKVLGLTGDFSVDAEESKQIAYRTAGRNVSDEVITLVLRFCKALGVNLYSSVCDFMYHCNIFALETGLGDGCGNFYSAK